MVDPTVSWLIPKRAAPKQAAAAAAAKAKAKMPPDEAILSSFMKKNDETGKWKLKSGTSLRDLQPEQFAEYNKLHPHAKPPTGEFKGALIN